MCIRYGTVLANNALQFYICVYVSFVCWYVAPPGERYYNTYVAILFIVECGIARFLCAMRVFEVRASFSSHRLPLCQISLLSRLHCWANPWRNIVYSITHSLTQLIWCSGNRSLRFWIYILGLRYL